MSTPSPPASRDILLQRAQAIAGLTLAEIAEQHHQSVPSRLQHAKGWAGQLLELCLGATAASRAEQDFANIGVELKTLPVNQQGQPLESTYVCTVPLDGFTELDWASSWVRRKLACVMWLPIEAGPDIPVAQRRIGTGFIWTPSPEQDVALQNDWEEHMELIQLGRVHEISAHHGVCLQIRPKAANSQALRDATDESGNRVATLPRGFYLRSRFTAQILAERYAT